MNKRNKNKEIFLFRVVDYFFVNPFKSKFLQFEIFNRYFTIRNLK